MRILRFMSLWASNIKAMDNHIKIYTLIKLQYLENAVEPGYNDIRINESLPITSDILWYQLTFWRRNYFFLNFSTSCI